MFLNEQTVHIFDSGNWNNRTTYWTCDNIMTALETSSKESREGTSTSAEIAKQIKSLLKELPEERADATRLDELRRLFGRLVNSGELVFGSSYGVTPENSVTARWQAFLIKQHKTMISQLCRRIQLGKRSAIRCMWGVMASSPLKSKNGLYEYINPDLLLKWIRSMTSHQSDANIEDKTMRTMIESEFLHPYRDVQYYALGAITQLATIEYDRYKQQRKKEEDSTKSLKVATKLLQLLLMIPVPSSLGEMADSQYLFPPAKDAVPDTTAQNEESDNESESDESEEESGEDSEEESDENDDEDDDDDDGRQQANIRPSKRQKIENQKLFAFQRLRCFRREYQKAWLAVLRLPLPLSSLKRVLQFLPGNVLKNVPHPLRFSDFFMHAYADHDGSGVVGVLALDGLFILITMYGLEYPEFYKQLYRLITPRVLHVKYRARFFALVTKCLTRNEMLPAHLVAAFAKRLCRCALSAPPSGILFVLALLSNLLRKHPECACLIHRRPKGGEMEDGFVSTQDDPEQSGALQSSLWELAILERHYHPAVVTLAKSIGLDEETRAPLHDMEEFARHTYKSLFDQERKNKRTKTPLTFNEPKSLFTDDDVFSDILQTE